MKRKQPKLVAWIDHPTAALPGHSIKEKQYPHLPIALVPLPYKPTAEQHERTVKAAHMLAAAPEMFDALAMLIEWADTDRDKPNGTFGHLAEKVIPAAASAIKSALGPKSKAAKAKGGKEAA